MATGEVLADITPRETLEAALAAIDYEAFRERQRAARGAGRVPGAGHLHGGRVHHLRLALLQGGGHSRLRPRGGVGAHRAFRRGQRLGAGWARPGRATRPRWSKAVAEGLGVDPRACSIHLGHTDIAPYGMGSRGARGGTAGGGTLYLCALDARAKVLAIAAHAARAAAADGLRMRRWPGRAAGRRRSGSDCGLTLADVARTAYLDPLALPPGMGPGLEFHKTYEPPPMTYSNSTHVCEVRLDAATGAIRFERYLVAEDCGTVLSPVVVEGQQHGAIAMGLSGALFEHVEYDASGQNLSGSLADYLVATAHELPHFEIIPMHTPNRRTPAGIKGMAEGGVMGAIGALTNAVNDALAPFGVVADRQPLTPMYLRDLLRRQPVA